MFLLQGEFIGIVGNVGSGKSSLLAGILAELIKENGHVALSDLERGTYRIFVICSTFVYLSAFEPKKFCLNLQATE